MVPALDFQNQIFSFTKDNLITTDFKKVNTVLGQENWNPREQY